MSIKYLWKSFFWEIKFQIRSIQVLVVLLFFSISLTVVYHYSLKTEVFLDKKNYYGLFLLSIFFMVILLSGRGLQREKEAGIYKIIIISPIPRNIFYLSRIFTKTLIILIILIIYQFIYKILLIGQIFFFENDFYIFILFIICTINLLSIGEIISLMSSGNRMKELILPTLFFPISIPVFIIYSVIIQNILEEKLNFDFFITQNFILPVILCLIYVLIGIFFFSNLSIEES